MAADPSPALPGPEAPRAPRGALAVGAALGGAIWWCEQVFSVTGGWVPTTAEARVRVHLAELSRVVGDHAMALRRHLPRPAPVDPEAWVAGRPGSDAVVATLAEPVDSLGRLAGVHRVVVPRLLVAWHVQRRAAGDADRARARSLGHAWRDLAALGLEGEALVQALVDATPEGSARAAAAAGAVEAALVEAGGVVPDAPPALPGAAEDR